AALIITPAAHATPPSQPLSGSNEGIVETPLASAGQSSHLTEAQSKRIFLADPKVAHWLSRYPRRGPTVSATYEPNSQRCTFGTQGGCWDMRVDWDPAGELASGRVDDRLGVVTEAWTGPQVAWKMARGSKGAFGGVKINSYSVWLGFCAAFLLGLAEFRRVLSWRNLDLVMLLSFSVSLWFFNRGNIFASVPLAYPPLVYLLARCAWIGFAGRPVRGRFVWPYWVLLGAAVFLAGFRIGLNVEDSNVIDVGYAGVIGAQRIAAGQSPYGNFPKEDSLKPCGSADADGEIRDRIQTNGRCESANENGDTYGPVSYESYLPGYWIRGWSGKWDRLPAAHFTAIAFDIACLVGLALVGLRFGGALLASVLPFAWAAYPFTQYVSSSNTNDSIPAAFLIWGFWLVTSAWARGIFVALSGWTKFASLVVAPLWLTYPELRWRPSRQLAYVGGFVLASAAAFSILLLEPHPLHAADVFFNRTLKTQIDRQSPFSLWDWRQYHARGLPDLHFVQRALEVLLVVSAVAFAFVPRRKSPLQLAALTAVLLLGFELVLTHWFYLYIPWVFPFVAFALLTPGGRRDTQPELVT
ncbi:MAG TPA: hypothetical protein VE736_10250, partial [Gaiellaceae bacterium]|nr:hypothetical protein [Gaiellaceae bacterium]